MAYLRENNCPTCNGTIQPLFPCPTCHGMDWPVVWPQPTPTEEKSVEPIGRPMVMKMIQKMPDIWDDARFLTSRTAVLGELACCAVRQTPYLVPDNLASAIEEMAYAISDLEEYFYTSCHDLRDLMRKSFDECPSIQAWNIPKKGNHQTVFVSRFDTPKADYDFIDLDAMARNIAHGITLQEKYNGLHD